MNHDAIVEITLVLKSLHDFSRSIIVFNIPNLPFVEVARVRIECTWLTVSGHVLAEEPHASRADGSCFRSLSWDCPHKEDRPWQTCQTPARRRVSTALACADARSCHRTTGDLSVSCSFLRSTSGCMA